VIATGERPAGYLGGPAAQLGDLDSSGWRVEAGRVEASYFPEDRSVFSRELAVRDRRFANVREAYLLDFAYNTARAYWGDLEQLFDWCEDRGFDIFALTEDQFRQYQALLRRRQYSESTIRRRRTAWHGFRRAAAARGRQPGPCRQPGTE
jgi:hypothetical protein